MNKIKIIVNGLIKENPIFVLLLGMCPTLGTSTSAINGLGMGLATMFVLICSNVVISLLKKLIPDMVRIPAFIVVIATVCDGACDAYEGIRSGIVRVARSFHSAYCGKLYRSRTC